MLREGFSKEVTSNLEGNGEVPAGKEIPSPPQTQPSPWRAPDPGNPPPSHPRVVAVNTLPTPTPTSAAQWGRMGPRRPMDARRGAAGTARPLTRRAQPGARSEHARCARPHRAPGGGCLPRPSQEAQARSPRRRAPARDWSSTHPVAVAMIARLQSHVKDRIHRVSSGPAAGAGPGRG